MPIIRTRLLFTVAAIALGIGLAAALAHAPQSREEAAQEDPAVIWEAQARTVAESLDLTEQQTTRLVAAYVAGRRAEPGFGMLGPPSFGSGGQDRQSQRDILEQELSAFLEPDQVAKAMGPLGAFSRRWDYMVETLQDLKLKDEVRQRAMQRMAEHITETSGAMARFEPGLDWAAIRQRNMAAREEFDNELAGILPADQMITWKERTAMRNGPGGFGMGFMPAPGSGLVSQ